MLKAISTAGVNLWLSTLAPDTKVFLTFLRGSCLIVFYRLNAQL